MVATVNNYVAHADLTGFAAGPSTYYNANFTYDQRNQLVGFAANDGPTPIKRSAYRYDCFNRRIASLVDADGDGTDDEVTYFIYAGQAAWQLVEEYPSPVPTWSTTQGEEDHDTTIAMSYVYGNYIDEVLQMRDHPSSEDYYYHQDDLFSVYAMTDEAGAVVERYEYGDYGQVSIMAEDGTSRAASLYGNRHTFTGRLLDDEMTLAGGEQTLQYRHRYMTTGSGRFLQRDPIEDQLVSALYTYTSGQPIHKVDPMGEMPMDAPPSLDPGNRIPPEDRWPGWYTPHEVPLMPTGPWGPLGPCGQDWLDCMVYCLEANSPSRLWNALPRAPVFPWPKTFVPGRVIMPPGSWPITTIPSMVSKCFRLGGRSTLRVIARPLPWVLVPWGTFDFGVQVTCAIQCANDPYAW